MATKYQLKNGLNVLLIESKKAPVVTVQMWVKTGSADEKKGVEGISHFIEHLVFKGSEKFGVGEIAQTIEGSGGVINAYTSFDQTVFYTTVSSQFADAGMEVISELVGHPRFDEQEINNEREVVIEEIKRSIDSPHQQSSHQLFSALYQKHPYGLPVLGYDEIIRKVPREKILNYYHSRYVPQNMNLVIVGDFKESEMKKRVAHYFAPIEVHKLMKVRRVTEPRRQTPIVSVKKSPFNESFFHLCFQAPSAKHKDSVPLMVLAAILGQGDSSRLVHEIRNEKNLVTSIGASVFAPKDLGFFAISATLDHRNLEATLNEITSALEQLFVKGPTDDELKKAIKQIESEKFYSMETVDGQAGLYGHFEFLFSDYNEFNRILKITAALTTKDVQQVARKYLSAQSSVVSYLAPENEVEARAQLKKWQKNLASALAKAKKERPLKAKKLKQSAIKWSAPKKSSAMRPQKIVLSNGVRIVGQQIVGSPVSSLRVGLLGGLRFEPIDGLGTNELLSRVWASGTKTLSEHELNIEVENMASGLGGFGGRNSIGLSATTLQPYFSRMFSLLTDVLIDPRLPQEAIEREKILMKEQIKTRNDKPSQLCLLSFMRLLFDKHPYARDPIGEDVDVEKLSRERILRFLTDLRHEMNIVLSVVGDINLRAFAKAVEEAWAKLPSSTATIPTNEKKISLSTLKENRHEYLNLDREQSHIAIGYQGLTFNDPARYALEVMQAILSGQGGRLFIELRDKASLAYTVSPIRMDGIEPGYFGAYIGCSPEKGDIAVEMLLKEFQKLMDEPVGTVEIERAKRYLLGRHDIGRQRSGHLADAYLFDELYGLAFDESEHFSERIATVDAQSIQKVAQKIFSQRHALSVVGRKDVSI